MTDPVRPRTLSLDPRPLRVERFIDTTDVSDPYHCGVVTLDLTHEGLTIEGPDRAEWHGTWAEFMEWLRAVVDTARANEAATEARRELAAAKSAHAQVREELGGQRALTAKLERLRAIGEGRIALAFCPRCKVGLRTIGG